MRGYDEASYGDAFADIYDDWYADLTDASATVARLGRLAGAGPVLELGVGTGRIAVPLAVATGVPVFGVDASEQMLARLSAKPGGDLVTAVLGDMTGTGLPAGSFTLVYVTYNTFFSILTDADQRLCCTAVASRLAPGGRFVIEAFVPVEPPQQGSVVELRSMAVDRVVLSVSIHDAASQRAEGHLIELTEGNGVRLRPWSIHYSTPEQLDVMAAEAGLELESRVAGWHDEPFDEASTHHVSTYRRPTE
ncbi:MAG: class I SAM-dependent methyltransferase [Acidimicrobiia bacterium]